MTDTPPAFTPQESVDAAERSLTLWINNAWAGRVPGDARDFRRAAGAAFDRLRGDLGLDPMPPAPPECAQDALSFYARPDGHPLRQLLSRTLRDDPVLGRTADHDFGPVVDRIVEIVEGRQAPPPASAPSEGLYDLAESWDSLRSAISRLMTSGLENATSAADRVRRDADAMDGVVKRCLLEGRNASRGRT